MPSAFTEQFISQIWWEYLCNLLEGNLKNENRTPSCKGKTLCGFKDKKTPVSENLMRRAQYSQRQTSFQNRQFASGEKGDVMIFNCKTAVRKAMLGKSGMNCISLILFTDDTNSFLNDFLGTNDFSSSDFFNDIRKSDSAVSFSSGELLEKLFLETIRLPGAFSKYTVRLAVIHAIILLIQKFRDKDGVDVRIKNDNPDAYFSGSTGRKVQNVRRIINSNLEKEISIEELANKVNLNRTTLQKVFKEIYGLTVNEYRTKARLQLAKNLLASTELSITEIAGRCGYANASKFSEVFKKNEGVLPKDWRK